MTIKNWPASERPREKLLLSGASNLSDAELFAILLRNGKKGQSAVDLARATLHQFDSLRELLITDKDEFCNRTRLSTTKYAELQAAVEIGKRFFAAKLKDKNILTNSAATEHYVMTRLRDYPQEVFAGLFLDSKNRLLAYEELAHGTLNYAQVYPREVAKHALRHNAASVIFAHNHPSGDATASPVDIALTKMLADALATLEIRVLDHLIVGDGIITSLARMGGW